MDLQTLLVNDPFLQFIFSVLLKCQYQTQNLGLLFSFIGVANPVHLLSIIIHAMAINALLNVMLKVATKVITVLSISPLLFI